MTFTNRFTTWVTRPSRTQRIEAALQRIETALGFQGLTLTVLTRKGDSMALDLSELRAAVAANNEVDQSAITLLNGLTMKLDELIAASGNTVDPADLAALVAELKASTGSLATAVSENTPAAAPVEG